MIVRINQFDAVHSEQFSGWPQRGPQGSIDYTWPADAHAFELVILDHDERQQPMARPFRQQQLRQLIPEVLMAMRPAGMELVVRLDGPVQQGELTAAFDYLASGQGCERFVISEVQKLEAKAPAPVGSVRMCASMQCLSVLCGDSAIGLERGVRLRVFCLPEELVNPLLDVSALDDERWPEILEASAFVLGSVRTLQSLHLLGRGLEADTVRERLTRRLLNRAEAAGSVAGIERAEAS